MKPLVVRVDREGHVIYDWLLWDRWNYRREDAVKVFDQILGGVLRQ